jgi:hypothetical protein
MFFFNPIFEIRLITFGAYSLSRPLPRWMVILPHVPYSKEFLTAKTNCSNVEQTRTREIEKEQPMPLLISTFVEYFVA